jgi:hypothetical protein
MSSSGGAKENQQTSVFNVLGSYADRIKDPKASGSKLNGSTTPSNSASASTPNGPSRSASKAASTKPVSTSNNKSVKNGDDKKEDKPTVTEVEEGAWETVQVGRSRPRGEKEERRGNAGASTGASGSSSRNWRDRPPRENKEKDEDEKPNGPSSSKVAKKASSSVPPTSSIDRTPRQTTITPPSGPAKPAWGTSTPITQQQSAVPQSDTTPGSTVSTSIQTPKTVNSTSNRNGLEPQSPSVNGTTATAESNPLVSPNPSGDLSRTSTAATSTVGKGEAEDGDWKKVEEIIPAPLVRQPAPPPAVNPWEMRKKALTSSTKASTSASSTPTPATSGAPQTSVPAQSSSSNAAIGIANGASGEGDKSGKKKKKASSEPSSAILGLGGKDMWPDVHQAAEAIKKDEEKKVVKEKKDSEEGSVAETPGAGPSEWLWASM